MNLDREQKRIENISSSLRVYYVILFCLIIHKISIPFVLQFVDLSSTTPESSDLPSYCYGTFSFSHDFVSTLAQTDIRIWPRREFPGVFKGRDVKCLALCLPEKETYVYVDFWKIRIIRGSSIFAYIAHSKKRYRTVLKICDTYLK